MGGRKQRGHVKSRRREGGRLVQQVRPRHDGGVTPGATRNARGASGRTRSRGRGGEEGNPPTPSVSPGRGDFGGINGSSISSNSDDGRASSDSSNSNDRGIFPRLWGDLRGTWRFSASSPHCKAGERGPSRGA